MAFTYTKLWKLLIDLNLTKEELRIKANMSPTTIASMGKNKPVSLDVIDRICNALECKPMDIMEYKKSNN